MNRTAFALAASMLLSITQAASGESVFRHAVEVPILFSEPRNAGDAVPDEFDLQAILEAELSSTVVSAPVAMTGFDRPVVVTASGSGALSLENGPFLQSVTVQPGQTFRVRVPTSPTHGGVTSTDVEVVGAFTRTFQATTEFGPFVGSLEPRTRGDLQARCILWSGSTCVLPQIRVTGSTHAAMETEGVIPASDGWFSLSHGDQTLVSELFCLIATGNKTVAQVKWIGESNFYGNGAVVLSLPLAANGDLGVAPSWGFAWRRTGYVDGSYRSALYIVRHLGVGGYNSVRCAS